MMSKRAIWWRSENTDACRSLTFTRALSVAFVALFCLPVLILIIVVQVFSAVEWLGWTRETVEEDGIWGYMGVVLGLPLLVSLINIPILAILIRVALRYRWTGILPTLATGVVYGWMWGALIYWAQLHDSNPDTMTIEEFLLTGVSGAVNAALIWLATRWLVPGLYLKAKC